MPYALKLAFAFLLTIAIEVPVCLLFGIRKKELLIVILANVITNPSLNVIFGLCWLYADQYALWVLAALEICAVLIEWRIYRILTGAKHPFWASLTANAVSFCIGLIISGIF